MIIPQAFAYDDVQIVPCTEPCRIESRKNVSLRTKLSKNIELEIPWIASPMDTICEKEMAEVMGAIGGAGFVHRFMSIEDQCKQLLDVDENYRFGTIGAKDEAFDHALMLADAGCRTVLIDVAHGNHVQVIGLIEKLKKHNYKPDIIAGNVATRDGTRNLCYAGVDGIRCGIGGGCFSGNSLVTTNRGKIPIKDVRIGDVVLTHVGRWMPVTDTFEFTHHDSFIKVNGIEATPNHEFYVVHKKDVDKITEYNLHEFAYWICAKDLTSDFLLIECLD